MNQEEHSSASASESQFPNTAIQIGDSAGETTPSSSRSTAPPRKRAPLASVACQDCRRRKTKCDGKKPACSNCNKRGVKNCIYEHRSRQCRLTSREANHSDELPLIVPSHQDLEPNQSRVAAYKQKIEQQLSSIKSLEDEIEGLKKSSFHSAGVARTSASEPTSSSSDNVSGGVPMRLLLNPAPEPGGSSSGQASTNTLGPYNPGPLPTVQMLSREAEFLNYQRNLETEMRKLQDENRTLHALIFLLNSMRDREQAQRMAQEIQSRGVSDDLLSRAQHLVATEVWKPLHMNPENQAKAPQQSGRAAENSTWSKP